MDYCINLPFVIHPINSLHHNINQITRLKSRPDCDRNDRTLDTVKNLRRLYPGEKIQNRLFYLLSIAQSVSKQTGLKISAIQKKVTDWLSDYLSSCGPRNKRDVAFPSRVLLAALIIVSLIVSGK
jgi:hypothetical protein